ncbi:MAG: amino acid adenylation domain-containing protein [Gemmatimonadota bacterium]
MSGAAGLSAEDLELMALLLEEAGIEDAGPEVIRPRPPGARVPLSFSQKRLWFLEQLEPETRIYNNVFGQRLLGALDVAALDAALGEVVRRHEALRTVFVEEDGEPLQVVLDDHPVRLDLRDLSGLPEEERMPAVRRIADEVTYRPFDLARGPLLRPTLLRLGEEDHALLLPVHHIVTDGWSQGIFWRELPALYAAAREGRPSPLPPVALQYGDFALWQQEHLAGGALERQLAYWKERLRGAPALLDLPTDRPRPAEQTYRGASCDFPVPEDVAGRLGALAQGEGATLFMVLLAALGALFARYTGEDDVVVGSPIANRTRPELEDVVGLFANTLAIRADLSGDPTFRALLGRVRDAVFEDFANQDLPFEKIVEELRIERSLAYNPVYQVLLALQNTPRPPGGFAGLEARPLELEHRKSKLDLALTVFAGEGGTLAGWEYSTELFDRATVVRLTDHFLVLLAAVAEDPDRRVSELPLVRPEERTRVLRTWNAGARDEPFAAPVHAQFAAQAARTPDAVAVAHRGGETTYAELARAAGRLASHLRARGVGPESRVGVCVERSPEMLVALLGVLGAGAAYVPLDPRYPRDRLALMVEDSGISVLLTQERCFAALPGGAEVVFLDADRERIDAGPDAWPEVPVFAESAAYVVYTSGSTGRPRGVVVPHGALAGFTAAAREAYGVGPADRVLQFASLAFDASAEEIWPALLSGARLVLRTEEMLDSARLFLDACRGAGITVLDLPTAYWHELVAELADEEGAELPESVRLVIIGGERALPERLRAWRERFGGRVRLVNTYGPTEATVVATLCELREPRGGDDAAAGPRHVPIGRPLGHARAYVLDARGEPSPVGVPGELHLGGGGLARGYPGDPARTAERFVPDPFGGGAGARLYRTGDRVRWLPDGTLEFIGRTDHQVKVRGFRVEPGEVEAVLARQPGVEAAAVAAREDAPGQVRLVAYVVPRAGAPLAVSALRAALRAELPPYMVPAAWVTLDALPLTRSGKTDRRALPAPDAVPAERGAGAAAPQSGVERAVAEAWREVLGVDSVGLDDNFFDLGGHSLLLARLRSRLAGRFPREVSIVVLFRYPTVRSLAEHLAGSEPAAAVEAPGEAEVESRRAAVRRRRGLKRDAAE